LLSSNISSTCPHNMVNFGPLAADIVSLVWGTRGNFNGFRFLAALLHGTLVVGVSQTLRRWTEGTTYIRQGGHHGGHWPTFLVTLFDAIPQSCPAVPPHILYQPQATDEEDIKSAHSSHKTMKLLMKHLREVQKHMKWTYNIMHVVKCGCCNGLRRV